MNVVGGVGAAAVGGVVLSQKHRLQGGDVGQRFELVNCMRQYYLLAQKARWPRNAPLYPKIVKDVFVTHTHTHTLVLKVGQ